MLSDPQDDPTPSDEAPALPLLVMTSSLLDLALRPTTSPINVASIYIVEEAFATFLAMSLEDQFAGGDGSARLVEIDVTVKAIRYDGLLHGGQRLVEDVFPDVPSTILTTTVRAKLRGMPDAISYKSGYLDNLIIGAFRNATDGGGRLEDLLALSSHPILDSVTGTEISLTSFAAFATGQATFAPSLPGTGAAVIDGNDITPGVFYQDQPSSLPKNRTFDKNDPMDLALVCMSGIILFATIIFIYIHHRVKDKGGSHEERIRHFFPGTDQSRATADAVYNDSSSDEGPINMEGRTVQPKILPTTGPLPTLTKYHYPIPKLRPRPQIKVIRLTNHATIGLNPIPEDQAFASPNYFDPENLRRSDSSIDIDSWLYEDADPLPAEDDGSCDTRGSFSRWNQWLQQVMVVNSGIRGDHQEDTCNGNVGDADSGVHDADDDLEDINIGIISKSYSSESGTNDGDSQISIRYFC